MHRLFSFAASAALLIPALALGDSPFDGTWKSDMSTAELPAKPHVYLLKDGIYHCDSCVPSYIVKADGSDQKVSGHPYFDTVSIKAVNDRTIDETDKKAGKTVYSERFSVSADGQTANAVATDSTAPNGPPVNVKASFTRVSRGVLPSGSNAITGSWKIAKLDSVSDEGLLVTYKLDGTTLKMSNPLGQSYAADTSGADAPYVGDPGLTSVSVKSLSPNAMEESDKRDGKVIWVGRMRVSADGKTMSVMWIDNLQGTTGSFTAKKQ
jgi:hypothetical protein